MKNAVSITPTAFQILSVVSSGIEPESRASETLILSIVLRDQAEIAKRFLNVINVINLVNVMNVLNPPIRQSANAPIRQSANLFPEPPHVRCKDLYGNGQQNYAKKLTYG